MLKERWAPTIEMNKVWYKVSDIKTSSFIRH